MITTAQSGGRIYPSHAAVDLMLATRPRKADAFLILMGLAIFVLLMLGVFLLVRREPKLAPKSTGAMATQGKNAGSASPKPVIWQY